MEDYIKVSVIIPVYNVEKYLEKCLDSIVNQTLKEIEIICINDGSVDSSIKILQKYKDKDNRFFILNQENQGISVARNNALKAAKGEYIGFVDSDDWIDLNYYEKMYNTAKKYDADIAISGIIKTNKKYEQKILSYTEEKIYEKTEEKLLICDIPDKSYVWNKIYKHEKLISSKINFIPNIIYEDIVFTPKIIHYTDKLVTVPDTNYYYFRHKHTLVRRKNKKAKSDLKYSKKIITDFMLEQNIDIENFSTKIKKYRIFGITFFKTKTKNNKKEHILLNCIKW